MSTPKLPPLPEPTWSTGLGVAFTAEQMQAYAIAAIEAQGVPDIDYEELIAAAYKRDRKWAQGTNGCIAFKYGAEWFREQVLASAPPAPQAEQHPDEVAVDRFAAAMKDKLATARQKGRGGWETCSAEDLGRMLREHVEKGDPRDVANFCMFLWSLGYGIAPQAKQQLLERIAELEQRNSDLHEDVQRFKEHALNEKAERLELDRELDEARKDAERYMWLREYYSPDIGRYASEMDLAFFENDDVLDATIDAAIKGTP